jgi:hypothetical protein
MRLKAYRISSLINTLTFNTQLSNSLILKIGYKLLQVRELSF